MNKKVISLLIVLVVIVCITGYFLVYKSSLGFDDSSYYAIFLSNGQVYFGNIKDKTDSDIVLTNVYYLQTEKNQNGEINDLSQQRFSLVKMGNEIHGPTNEMFINRQNVLFYEKLRSDSKVVSSIKDYK